MIRALKGRRLAVCLMICGLSLTSAFGFQDAPTRSDVAVPAGTALSESEIIILLQAKVPLDLIEKFVNVRGVNFMSSKETSKKILSAGGNVSLIGTISLNQKDDMSAMPMAAANGAANKKKK